MAMPVGIVSPTGIAEGQYVIGTCDAVTGPPTQFGAWPAVQPVSPSRPASTRARSFIQHPVTVIHR
jgi:hypothetical protein